MIAAIAAHSAATVSRRDFSTKPTSTDDGANAHQSNTLVGGHRIQDATLLLALGRPVATAYFDMMPQVTRMQN